MIEAAALLSALALRWEDLAIIATMLLINAAVGFFEHRRGAAAKEALGSFCGVGQRANCEAHRQRQRVGYFRISLHHSRRGFVAELRGPASWHSRGSLPDGHEAVAGDGVGFTWLPFRPTIPSALNEF